MNNLFLKYIIFINIVSALLFIYDKVCAIKRRYRVKENILILFVVLGGAISSCFVMYFIRHKTTKIKFIIIVPLFFILWVLAIYTYYVA